MNKNSRIYIAGHNGLVGSALYRRLNADGYSNLIVRNHSDLDLTRQKDVEAFFQLEKPDHVFLAAAKLFTRILPFKIILFMRLGNLVFSVCSF
jgi:GDP-L-fucose synthase